MKLSLFFLSLMLLALNGANHLNADELITPLESTTGVHGDAAARMVLPHNKVISDQAMLDKVWTGLAIAAAKPKINWDTEMLLADSVSGPNKMNVIPLILNNGRLKFVSFSTKMGGPGFGYVIVRIPSKGITHVNGFSIAKDVVVHPIATYRGANGDRAIIDTIAPGKLIVDQVTFDKAWKSVALKGKPPGIDWNSEVVLVAVAGGNTNRITMDKMILSAYGRLRFVYYATEMGSPGHCYLLVRVPKKGIEFVNQTKIPKHDVGDGVSVADGVTVNIVGKLQTGIMAIGGETTGTIIEAGNITFEIDLTGDRGLQGAAQRLNNKRVRVLGKLTKKRGAEVRERWILKATSIEEVATANSSEEGASIKSFVELKFVLTGGIAGFDQELTIDAKNGKAKKVDRRRRVTESFQVKPDKLANLHSLIGKTDWTKIPRLLPERGQKIADGMGYLFTINNGQEEFGFSRDDGNLAQSKELMALAKLLHSLGQ